MKKRATLLLCLSIPLVLLVYTFFFDSKTLFANYVMIAATVTIVALLFSHNSNNKFAVLFHKIVLGFNLTYILLEVATWICLSFGILRTDINFWFGGLRATDSPIFKYDTLSGCKYNTGKHNYIFIQNGNEEINVNAHVNNQGWCSYSNYTHKKSKPRTKRYMVLGDSFSSGMSVDTTWIDLVQKQLDFDSIQLYNFAIDGSGLINWHRIFFKEIIPNYEFDGIIIAPSFEPDGVPDFDRKFLISASDSITNFHYAIDIFTDSIPEKFPFDKAVPAAPVYSATTLKSIKEYYVKGKYEKLCFLPPSFTLPFLSTFYGVTDGIYKMIKFSNEFAAYRKPYESYHTLADSTYKMEYFDKRYKYGFMLKEILAYCKKHNIDVILASIPDHVQAGSIYNGNNCIYKNEVAFLAKTYSTKYFDGFGIFDNTSSVFIQSCFYPHDKHLNNKGVKLFAKKISESNLFGN